MGNDYVVIVIIKIIVSTYCTKVQIKSYGSTLVVTVR
jgi:hypothetical protein